MHMVIYALVEASTHDDALATGKTVFDRLVGADPHSCAVFDTLDGPYYEIDGERFRERGLVSPTSERRARNELERFLSRSIATLRVAARRADEDAADRITQDVVEQALPQARQELRRRHIERLPPHHQAIFSVIEEHDRIAPRDLFEEHRKRVDEPKSNRTVQK